MARPRVAVPLLLAATAAAALLAPGATAAPPADAFCVILFEATDAGFGTVRVLVDLETNLTQREELFGKLDADADGDVDPLEQEHLRAATVRQHNSTEAMGITALAMAAGDGERQWGAGFLAAKTWTQVGHTFHKQDHVTPAFIMDPADLETQEVREVYFRHQGTPTVVDLQGGSDPASSSSSVSVSPPSSANTASTSTTVTIEYVVVRAPPGWVVESATGSSYEGHIVTQGGAQELDLPAFDTRKPFHLRFAVAPEAPASSGEASSRTTTTAAGDGAPEDSGERGSPAASLLGVVAALAAAGLALRRRL